MKRSIKKKKKKVQKQNKTKANKIKSNNRIGLNIKFIEIRQLA